MAIYTATHSDVPKKDTHDRGQGYAAGLHSPQRHKPLVKRGWWPCRVTVIIQNSFSPIDSHALVNGTDIGQYGELRTIDEDRPSN